MNYVFLFSLGHSVYIKCVYVLFSQNAITVSWCMALAKFNSTEVARYKARAYLHEHIEL